ncbi:MAG: aldo/keto reductase [Pseudomonadota bacterium]
MRYGATLSNGSRLSRIGLGSWLTYGSHVDECAAQECIDAALDVGINVFDTAPNYGGGAAEEILGRALRHQDRSKIAILTKISVAPGEETDRNIFGLFDASRRRLKTDYVDIVKIHHFDYSTDNARILDCLQRLKSDGAIRGIGVCNWAASHMQKHLAQIDCTQNQYNLLWRYPERDVFRLSKSNGLLRFSWSSLAQGVLTGKYHHEQRGHFVSRGNHPQTARFLQPWMNRETHQTVTKLMAVSEHHSIDMVNLALSWIIQTDRIDCALIGARNAAQVIASACAVDDTLPLDLVNEIDSVTSNESMDGVESSEPTAIDFDKSRT